MQNPVTEYMKKVSEKLFTTSILHYQMQGWRGRGIQKTFLGPLEIKNRLKSPLHVFDPMPIRRGGSYVIIKKVTRSGIFALYPY